MILKKFTFYKSKGGEGSKKKWEGTENVLIFQVSFLKPYDSNYYNCTLISIFTSSQGAPATLSLERNSFN